MALRSFSLSLCRSSSSSDSSELSSTLFLLLLLVWFAFSLSLAWCPFLSSLLMVPFLSWRSTSSFWSLSSSSELSFFFSEINSHHDLREHLKRNYLAFNVPSWRPVHYWLRTRIVSQGETMCPKLGTQTWPRIVSKSVSRNHKAVIHLRRIKCAASVQLTLLFALTHLKFFNLLLQFLFLSTKFECTIQN